MTREEIQEKLHSSNPNLNKVINEQNFIEYANLHTPVIGQKTFQDIENNFNFLLKEQYIKETFDYGVDTSDVFPHFRITKDEFDCFKNNVNEVLDSYTDSRFRQEKKREILKNQLKEFTQEFDTEDTEDIYNIKKMHDRLHTDNQSSATRYLNSILEALDKATVNQIDNDKYLAIEKLSNEYIPVIKLKNAFFREKTDYLKRLKKNDKKEQFFLKIHEYIVEIYKASVCLEDVTAFIFYLTYGKNKIHIYLIHYILGVDTKAIRELYVKLFLFDKKVGSDKNFLLYTICNPKSMTFVINDYDLVKKNKLHKRFDYESLGTKCQEVLDDLLYIEANATLEEILITNIPFEKIVNFSEYENIYKKI